MTYNQTKKEINRLYTLLKNRPYHYEVQTVADVICEGHGAFFPTGTYTQKDVLVYDNFPDGYEATIRKQIAELQATINDEEQRRYNKAKYKRYLKEVEELRKELTYKEKFIKEYEEKH